MLLLFALFGVCLLGWYVLPRAGPVSWKPNRYVPNMYAGIQRWSTKFSRQRVSDTKSFTRVFLKAPRFCGHRAAGGVAA